MAGIADFLDSLIGGFDLICFALVVGGLVWSVFFLRPWQIAEMSYTLLCALTAKSIALGSFALAGAQVFKLLLKVWLMAAVLEKWPFPEFAQTTQFIGGMIRAVLAFMLALHVNGQLRQHPLSKSHWLMAVWFAVPLVICGAWLVHGAGRFENQLLLMTLTVIHQVAASVWVGGVFQLGGVWWLIKKQHLPADGWRQFLAQFSWVGAVSVFVILLSGLPLALQYIDTWSGLIGTGYGNLLMVKIVLMTLALGLAWLNRCAARQGDRWLLMGAVPYYIEVETLILVMLLFTAASLASQPPAVDIPDLTATWQEVLGTFKPQMPQINSPTHHDLLAGEAARTAIVGQIPSIAATEWSNYNHNISGIFLAVMSVLAMLSYTQQPLLSFSRYWPLGFVLLGIFLFFRSDAETWPLGPIGFWESTFNNGEVLQHRIATLLVFVLGMIELASRLKPELSTKLPLIFPVLAAFGGLMLLTHSHVGFQPKSAFLIQVGHTAMGVFALILASGRWLELRLDKTKRALPGFVSVFALFQMSLILMFYREPLY